jgi:hypothetical protein
MAVLKEEGADLQNPYLRRGSGELKSPPLHSDWII